MAQLFCGIISPREEKTTLPDGRTEGRSDSVSARVFFGNGFLPVCSPVLPSVRPSDGLTRVHLFMGATFKCLVHHSSGDRLELNRNIRQEKEFVVGSKMPQLLWEIPIRGFTSDGPPVEGASLGEFIRPNPPISPQ